EGGRSRINDALSKLTSSVVPDYTVALDATGANVVVSRVAPGHEMAPSFSGVVTSEVAKLLPPRSSYTPAVWANALNPAILNKVLVEKVPGQANAAYKKVLPAPTATVGVVDPVRRAAALTAARHVVDRESRMAGLLVSLNQRHQYGVLE